MVVRKMVVRKVLSLLVILAVCGSLFATPKASGATQIKVACIGDSTTEGNGNKYPLIFAYPPQLQNMLGSGYVVHNYGLGGRTMLKHGDISYWNDQFYIDSSNWLPDIVIIQLGTNDSKPQNWQYKSQFVSNYVEMIKHYQNLSSHPTVYVSLCDTVYAAIDNGITDAVVTKEVVPLVIQAASQTGAPVIDNNTFTRNMPTNFPDGVHPNDVGAFSVASTVFNAICPSPANVALGKTATASSYNTNEEPLRAMDGSVANSKWCSGLIDGEKTLTYDLGQSFDITRWVVKNASTGGEEARLNTRDYTLQKSDDGITWTDVDPVTWNTASITDRNVTKFSSRYVRLHITNTGADSAARIYEFEVYGTATSSITSSFESIQGQTQPTWSNTLEASSNVSGYNSDLIPECSIRYNETPQAHTGIAAIMFSGTATLPTISTDKTCYAYSKVFHVNIPITSTTQLSYWFLPQQENGRHVAIDFICTDGTTLRDSGIVDQNGISIHPATARGTINAWNYIQCDLGTKLNGKTIDRINIGYDNPSSVGQFRGFIDDITIK